MKRVVIGLVIGFILGIIVIPIIAFFYVRMGCAPVATNSRPLPLERQIAETSLDARMKHEAPKDSPVPANEETFMAGAKIYRQNCAVCHGTKGQPQTAIAKGMFPKPPQFFEEDGGMMDHSVGETYWMVSNGIRLSGMPAFGESLGQTNVWQVSQMLVNADKLPASAAKALSAER